MSQSIASLSEALDEFEKESYFVAAKKFYPITQKGGMIASVYLNYILMNSLLSPEEVASLSSDTLSDSKESINKQISILLPYYDQIPKNLVEQIEKNYLQSSLDYIKLKKQLKQKIEQNRKPTQSNANISSRGATQSRGRGGRGLKTRPSPKAINSAKASSLSTDKQALFSKNDFLLLNKMIGDANTLVRRGVCTSKKILLEYNLFTNKKVSLPPRVNNEQTYEDHFKNLSKNCMSADKYTIECTLCDASIYPYLSSRYQVSINMVNFLNAVKKFEEGEELTDKEIEKEIIKVHQDKFPTYSAEVSAYYSLFKKDVSISKLSASILYQKGLESYNKGEFDHALDNLSAAIHKGAEIAKYLVAHIYLFKSISTPENFKLGLQYLKDLAKLNDPNAQFDLALLYSGVPFRNQNAFNQESTILYNRLSELGNMTNPNKAIRLCKLAMKSTHCREKAATLLSNIMLQKATSKKEKLEAIEKLENYAQNGDANAFTAVLNFYLESKKDYPLYKEKALNLCKLLASKDIKGAKAYLGIIYLGKMSKKNQDLDQAFELLKEASENNIPIAQLHLGKLYIKSSWPHKNNDLALQWFETVVNNQASTKDDILSAIRNIGLLYYKRSIKNYSDEDRQNACSWLEKAAVQGDPSAQSLLGQAYYDLDFKTQDATLAIKWNEAAFNNSEANLDQKSTAAYDIGYIYEHDSKVRNMPEATKWYSEAAKNGYIKAYGMLARLYFGDTGMAPDYQKALYFCRKAAEKGETSCQCCLAQTLLEGQYGFKDEIEGKKWIKVAMDKEMPEAYAAYAQYLKGKDANQYQEKIIKLCNKAISLGFIDAIIVLHSLAKKVSPSRFISSMLSSQKTKIFDSKTYKIFTFSLSDQNEPMEEMNLSSKDSSDENNADIKEELKSNNNSSIPQKTITEEVAKENNYQQEMEALQKQWIKDRENKAQHKKAKYKVMVPTQKFELQKNFMFGLKNLDSCNKKISKYAHDTIQTIFGKTKKRFTSLTSKSLRQLWREIGCTVDDARKGSGIGVTYKAPDGNIHTVTYHEPHDHDGEQLYYALRKSIQRFLTGIGYSWDKI